MNSLLKIVKQPKLVKYQDVVTLEDHHINLQEVLSIDEDIAERFNREVLIQEIESEKSRAKKMVEEAKLQAQDIIHLAKQKAQHLQETQLQAWQEQRIELEQQVRRETIASTQVEITAKLEASIACLQENILELHAQQQAQNTEQLQNIAAKAHRLSIAIAEKILQQQIEVGFDVEHLILQEVKRLKKQKINRVCLSDTWEQTTKNLANALAELGIHLDYEQKAKDTIVIESEMGQYDISLSTQLENVKQLFDL
ncbi:MAG: hypothetical protein ACRCZJ_08155 [Erysipelotrichaceae bacterium]